VIFNRIELYYFIGRNSVNLKWIVFHNIQYLLFAATPRDKDSSGSWVSRAGCNKLPFSIVESKKISMGNQVAVNLLNRLLVGYNNNV